MTAILGIMRKIRPIFFPVRQPLFWKKIIFLELLGPKDMILQLAQRVSEYIVDPYKFLLDVCRTR